MIRKSIMGLFLSLLGACGSPHVHDNSGTRGAAEIEEDGCEHRAEGPYKTVGAVTELEKAPLHVFNHASTRVTLPNADHSRVGYVAFSVADAGDTIIYVGSDASLTITDIQAKIVPFETSKEAIKTCKNVLSFYYVAHLEVGRYTLKLETSSNEGVDIVMAELDESAVSHDNHISGTCPIVAHDGQSHVQCN